MQLSDFIADMRQKLFDPAPGVGWSNTELTGYLNEAIRATVFVKPDAYTVQDTAFGLVAGILQQLPAAGIALIDIPRNKTARVVTQVDEGLLEEANRFWPAATRQKEVEHFTADPRNPRRFRVFPPNNGSGEVEILYGAIPAAMVADSDPFLLPDSYQYAVTCHALAQALSKASKRQNLQHAQMLAQQWAVALGLKSTAQVAVAPKTSQSPGI